MVGVQPNLSKPCLNARARSSAFGSFSPAKSTKPTRTRLACSARATSGQATAALLKSVMNCRRLMGLPLSAQRYILAGSRRSTAAGRGTLFNHLIGPNEQRRWHSEAESLGRFEVDD